MWNNITHGNTNMNRFERLMEHKGHLERLAQTKNVIDTKNPKIPSFITKKMIDPGNRMERALKIHYENQVIYNRMYEIRNKTSPYSACMNIPSKCPAYELLTYHRLKKNNVLKTENGKLFKRFTYARPTYNANNFERQYAYNKYIGQNISQNRNRTNPNLDFVSFEKFNKKIRSRSFYGKINRKIKSHNNSFNASLERSNTCYSSRKFLPSETKIRFIHNDQNEEWFKDADFENKNNIGKPKLKRPNSCRPNIIISREPQDLSDNLSSEPYYNTSYNISHKTFGNKPASGKARTNHTNGSYSTNVLTTP